MAFSAAVIARSCARGSRRRPPGGHGVRGGQIQPGGLQVSLCVFPVVVGRVERGDDLLGELLHVAEPIAALVVGVADRLEELTVGPVPVAGVPVGVVARLVAGGARPGPVPGWRSGG